MASGSIWDDNFEKTLELGRSTVKSANPIAKKSASNTVKKAVSDMAGKTTIPADERMRALEQGRNKKKPNHTTLDPQKLAQLEEGYKNQDSQKVDSVRGRLEHYFKLQKEGERYAIEARKREEEERKRLEEEEKAFRKKQKEDKGLGELVVPKGKERKSIFSVKQRVKSSQAETRAGSGKQ